MTKVTRESVHNAPKSKVAAFAHDAFYSPLARLERGDARVYLGMIHSMNSL